MTCGSSDSHAWNGRVQVGNGGSIETDDQRTGRLGGHVDVQGQIGCVGSCGDGQIRFVQLHWTRLIHTGERGTCSHCSCTVHNLKVKGRRTRG